METSAIDGFILFLYVILAMVYTPEVQTTSVPGNSNLKAISLAYKVPGKADLMIASAHPWIKKATTYGRNNPTFVSMYTGDSLSRNR
jgi:hypothetical protein